MVLLSVSLSGESKAKSLYRSLCHGRGDYKRLHQAISLSLSYGVEDGALNRLGGTWVELRFFRPPLPIRGTGRCSQSRRLLTESGVSSPVVDRVDFRQSDCVRCGLASCVGLYQYPKFNRFRSRFRSSQRKEETREPYYGRLDRPGAGIFVKARRRCFRSCRGPSGRM